MFPTRQIKASTCKENCEKCPKFKRLDLVMILKKSIVLVTKNWHIYSLLGFFSKKKKREKEKRESKFYWRMANGLNLETNSKTVFLHQETNLNKKTTMWPLNKTLNLQKKTDCINQQQNFKFFEKQTSTCWCDPLEINSKLKAGKKKYTS